MTNFFSAITKDEIESATSVRSGETKVGEVLMSTSCEPVENPSERLQKSYASGVRYGIILVPEDIGPRGNLGRPGAASAPDAFLANFCNMQFNRFYDYSKVMVAGRVELKDLQNESQGASTEKLRELCETVDERVQTAVELVVNAGLKPIVLGGGNNNSLPTIRGVSIAAQIKDGINCINCDPHADYRNIEGRHSGNPFSYAQKEGLLNKYCVFALHESYNSEDMMERLNRDGFIYFSYEECFVRKDQTYEEQLEDAAKYFQEDSKPLGVELDLDSIKSMPSSALTPVGITEEEAVQFIHSMTSQFQTHYLHLSEGAPNCTTDDGIRKVGKFMALAVNTFLKADNL